jgi:predicted Zn-dependent protease
VTTLAMVLSLLLAALTAQGQPQPTPKPSSNEAHARFDAACKLHQSGDAAGARKEFQALLDGDPKNGRLALAIAAFLIQARQDYSGGEPFARRARELLPDEPIACTMLGGALLGALEVDEAERVYRDGFAKFPDRAALAFGVGMSCAQAKRFLDAKEWFEKAIALDPKSPQFHFSHGENFANLRMYPQAEAELKRAEPGWPDAGWKLGEVLGRQGRAEEAEQVLRATLAKSKGSTRWHAAYQLGVLLFEHGGSDPGRYDEAESLLRNVTQSKPTDQNGWLYLSRVLRARGKSDEAAAAVKKYQELAAAADRREDEQLTALIKAQLEEKPAPKPSDH